MKRPIAVRPSDYMCRFGFTSRMWGLNLDNIVSATVVLANGTIVEASATNHSDLFWVRQHPPAYIISPAVLIGDKGTTRGSAFLRDYDAANL